MAGRAPLATIRGVPPTEGRHAVARLPEPPAFGGAAELRRTARVGLAAGLDGRVGALAIGSVAVAAQRPALVTVPVGAGDVVTGQAGRDHQLLGRAGIASRSAAQRRREDLVSDPFHQLAPGDDRALPHGGDVWVGDEGAAVDGHALRIAFRSHPGHPKLAVPPLPGDVQQDHVLADESHGEPAPICRRALGEGSTHLTRQLAPLGEPRQPHARVGEPPEQRAGGRPPHHHPPHVADLELGRPLPAAVRVDARREHPIARMGQEHRTGSSDVREGESADAPQAGRRWAGDVGPAVPEAKLSEPRAPAVEAFDGQVEQPAIVLPRPPAGLPAQPLPRPGCSVAREPNQLASASRGEGQRRRPVAAEREVGLARVVPTGWLREGDPRRTEGRRIRAERPNQVRPVPLEHVVRSGEGHVSALTRRDQPGRMLIGRRRFAHGNRCAQCQGVTRRRRTAVRSRVGSKAVGRSPGIPRLPGVHARWRVGEAVGLIATGRRQNADDEPDRAVAMHGRLPCTTRTGLAPLNRRRPSAPARRRSFRAGRARASAAR